MNRKPFLKSLSEGRGNCPLPSRTHPQKQNLVVYTEELTHLTDVDDARDPDCERCANEAVPPMTIKRRALR
jgi:hypothetical protein